MQANVPNALAIAVEMLLQRPQKLFYIATSVMVAEFITMFLSMLN
jgi:hypothetical protein